MRPQASFARLGALALVASVMLGGAACGLVAGLDKLTFQDPATCAEACDDLDPCTESDCLVDGACHGTAVPDGPLATDPLGNCQTVACAGGVAKTTVDDSDVPDDDGNSCTDEACTEGAPSHTTRPDGEPCMLGDDSPAAVCDSGKCAAKCTETDDCDDHEPCTIDACDPVKSLCQTTPLADGTPTPGDVPVPGDCRAHVCLAGVDTNAPDDLDLIPAANDCIAVTCTAGTPSSPPMALGVMCTYGGGQVCDGAGACVACNVTADCAPTGDECKVAICNADKTCGTTNTPADTLLSPPLQIKGNCKTLYCDGMGAAVTKNNNGDVPDDGNPCTSDKCTAGVPSNVPGLAGVDCGVGQKCNAAGQCGCADSTQCIAPDTCGGGNPGTAFTCGCTKTTCAAVGATCGLISDGCFATLACNSGTKNGTETDVDCGGGGKCTTACAAGKVCAIDSDCASGHCADGVCCNTACAGTCMACNNVGSLGTCGNLDVGKTDSNATVPCAAPSACNGAGACKKTNGQSCITSTQCLSVNCIDGVCCSTTCATTCMACNLAGLLGLCSNIPTGQPDTAPANACTVNNRCDGLGACKLAPGQPCMLGSQCASTVCLPTLLCQ